MIPPVVLASLLAAAPADQRAPDRAPAQVSIDNAAGGGLRDWQPVPGKPGELYVRDRTERWYRVRLSAPCERYGDQDTMTYTTDTNGLFDRFSTVSFARAGPIVCAVLSVVRSDGPPLGSRRR